MKSLALTFNNTPIHATRDAWFNATDMANAFGKRPIDWLKQKETKEYIALLCVEYEVTENHFVKTKKGGNLSTQGTWLHRKLAIRFAQWLDTRFAIWCDERIEELLSGERQQARNDTKASNRLMNKVLHLQLQGEEASPFYYSNNVLMCYQVMTGERLKVDRDSLPANECKLLAEIELENAALTLQGLNYHERKKLLIAKYSPKLADNVEVAL